VRTLFFFISRGTVDLEEGVAMRQQIAWLWGVLFPPREGKRANSSYSSGTNECQHCGKSNTLQLEIKKGKVVGFRCNQCGRYVLFGFNAQ